MYSHLFLDSLLKYFIFLCEKFAFYDEQENFIPYVRFMTTTYTFLFYGASQVLSELNFSEMRQSRQEY